MPAMRTARRRRQGPSRVVSGGSYTKTVAKEILAEATYTRDKDGMDLEDYMKGGDYRAKVSRVREQK